MVATGHAGRAGPALRSGLEPAGSACEGTLQPALPTPLAMLLAGAGSPPLVYRGCRGRASLDLGDWGQALATCTALLLCLQATVPSGLVRPASGPSLSPSSPAARCSGAQAGDQPHVNWAL